MTDFANRPILVFDVETVADIDGARRIYPELASLNDQDALTALTSLRTQEAGHDFMRLPLHRIVCISVLYIKSGQFSLFSLTADEHSEKEILATFFRAFNDLQSLPQLVSWNGSGFDIPVIIYRAMQYDLSVPLLFETGDRIHSMRFDNYVSRYHDRHLDLMDRFSQYGSSRRESMNLVASLYGLPGKTDIDGSMVGDLVQREQWHELALYCESDALNTWLIFLRWLRLTGTLNSANFESWQAQTRDYLSTKREADDSIRHQAFLDHWPDVSNS
ncbi:3'-5' exonuclease [Psychrobacter sp. FDAARGOS_221]|uniref:3'-5' exonuclease n=1 Tax=Psychrobacter sp. FDAARGOS_221 TaxID=1975705 RepID=UPI000BB52DF8|nr:3'-5' exonuclease [Psychrobacter sp. FDAARGOS_221]PNK60371.1 3'-5' exonuclease [Psychrobacter sp. FDAARGOS_221]